jgi:RNA polymerase sigma factor (sigma-70 family)
MMPPNDLELLEEYLERGSEEAFATLVHRHLDLVYSAALRQVAAPQFAEEIAQSVFIDLAKNGARLAQRKSETLAAWLFQVTRRTAVDHVRRESRRQLREQLAAELNVMDQHPSIWSRIEPLLDEAMETLDSSERSAILLRFFENKTLREVGETLGTSEDAAQKRVSRAVESLRGFFSKHGVAVGASGLAAALSVNAVQGAPLGLGTAISTAASGAALHGLHLGGTTQLIAMTTMQKILITVVVTAGLGAALYQRQRATHWQEQALALQQQQAALTEQVHQSQRERDETASHLSAMREENDELRRSTAELPKLRAEVGRLRQSSHELAQLKASAAITGNDPDFESAYKTWAARASRLRQRLDQSAGQRIPELQFLTEKSWFDAVKAMNQLETDEDYRKAFSNARNIAKGEFGRLLQKALRGYTDANGGQLPQDLAQLRPFFEQPVDDSVLQRYTLLQTGKLSESDGYLVGENAPLVDEENDATFQFSLNGTSSHSGNRGEDAVRDSVMQYAAAHGDLLPTDPAQLEPYLKPGLDPAKIREVLAKIPTGVTTLQELKAALH